MPLIVVPRPLVVFYAHFRILFHFVTNYCEVRFLIKIIWLRPTTRCLFVASGLVYVLTSAGVAENPIVNCYIVRRRKNSGTNKTMYKKTPSMHHMASPVTPEYWQNWVGATPGLVLVFFMTTRQQPAPEPSD